MFRGLFSRSSKDNNDNIDIKNSRFPDQQDYKVFQCIEDLRNGKATVYDLESACLSGGIGAIEKTANIENITGPESQSIFGPLTRTFKGTNLTPIDYAFLTGRLDAFKVLLAFNANIDKTFFFQCTSMNPEPNKESKTTDSLMNLMLQYNHGKVIDDFRAQDVRNAFFIALIKRKNLIGVLNILLALIKKNHKLKTDYLDRTEGSNWRNKQIPDYVRTQRYEADRVFALVPSIKIIEESLGTMDGSYKDMLDQLIEELTNVRAAAWAKRAEFITYDDEAVEAVIKPLDQLISCFERLRNNLDDNLSHDQYLQQSMRVMFANDINYDRDKKIEELTISIGVKINYACYWLDKDDDELENNADKCLQTIVSMAAGMVSDDKSELYREALLGFVKKQVSGYAKSFNDSGLQALADHLSGIKLPIIEDDLKKELSNAIAEVNNFSSQSSKTSLRM
jgi:hypothetical protein